MIDNADLIEKARALGAETARGRPFEAERSHPGFKALAREVTTLWGATSDHLHERGERTLDDVARFAGALWIAYLEATPGGLTLQRLDQTMKAAAVGGVGRARAVLTYLSYIRYIERAPSEGDGRFRRYRATPTARRVFRERYRAELLARRAVDPAIQDVVDRIDDPAVFDALVIAATEAGLVTIAEQAETPNPTHLFADRDRGSIVLYQLLDCGGPGDDYPPRGPLAFSIYDLAKRSGASRMQVSHLLRMAREAGLLVPADDGGEALSEALVHGVEMLVASSTRILVGASKLALEHAGEPTA